MPVRPFRAKYPGTCSACRRPIAPKDLLTGEKKNYRHFACPIDQERAMLDVPEAIFIATYELPIERRASFLQAHGYYPDGPRPWAKLVPRVPGVKV